MSEIIKNYTNGEVTIVWKPKSCIHSAICVNGLPQVFRPKDKPWIEVSGASTEELVEQVKKCPSGALSYFMNDESDEEAVQLETKVEVMKNGPLLVYGTLHVTGKDGQVAVKNKTTAFCRCGASANKPYCDGSHIKAEFRDE